MGKFRILALDGGGIRGFLTTRILRRLSTDPRLAGVFESVDLIAGTSSGGLIALAMAAGRQKRVPMPLALAQLEQLFEGGGETFGRRRPFLLGGTWWWARYAAASRERTFRNVVGELTLGDLVQKVLIPAFDLDNEGRRDGKPDSQKWKPKLFHNLDGERHDCGLPIWKVAMYTTALPVYFPSADGYIDGGVYANNPAMCALAQVFDPRYGPRPKPALHDIVMLSIGSGRNLKSLPRDAEWWQRFPFGRRKGDPKAALDWGAVRWGKSIVDVIVDGTDGIGDYQSAQLLGAQRHRRIAPEFTPGTHFGTDDLDRIGELKAFADEVFLEDDIEWLQANWLNRDAAARRPRAKEKTSKHILTTTELTCRVPIRDGFVGVLDTRSFATRLRIVMRVLHALREKSREAHDIKMVVDIVDAIRSIHSFQFAILDDRQLLLAVTFAGAWEPYLRIIWRRLGALIDLVLCNCAGYEASSSDRGFERFAGYIRQHQVESDFFYPASGQSVDDRLYLTQVEQLARHGVPGDLDGAIARLVVENPNDAVKRAAKAFPGQAAAQVAGLLRVLSGLREMFPESEPDHVFLERAAYALLSDSLETITLEDLANAGASQSELVWLEKIVHAAAKPPQEPPRQRGPEDEIQGGILKPYKRTIEGVDVPATHGCLLLARITDAKRARRFLRGWVDEYVTREPDPGAARLYHHVDGVYHNIAFTFAGLRSIGVPAPLLESFPKEFREGMEQRAGLLGDVRSNHPDNWVLPEWNVEPVPVGFDREAPRVRMSTIDVVVQMRAVAPDGADRWGHGHPLFEAVTRFCDDAGHHGIQVLSRQLMRDQVDVVEDRLRGKQRCVVRDHFGFVEGISQPSTDGARRDRVSMGELLCGYDNDRGDPAFPERDAPGANAAGLSVRGSLLDNGTFLVIRKLEQHVEALRAAVAASGLPEEGLLAKMMGRTRDGVPLADPSTTNDFDYDRDPEGAKCPLHAHIRRANPRTTLRESPVPRIMRRGMSYGRRDVPAWQQTVADAALVVADATGTLVVLTGQRESADPPDMDERGLMFMAYNASIAEQFEVIQRWLTGGNSTGLFSAQRDPLVGVPEPGEAGTFRFLDGQVRRPTLGDEPFVSLRWGLYLFVPSIAALRELTADPAADAFRQMAQEQVLAGQAIMQGLQTANDWARVYEDVSAVHGGVTAAVSAAIRALDGGVRRTPYGVLVTSERFVMQVLRQDEIFSVAEYRTRMASSIGEIYLGLDAGDEYHRQSWRPNAAVQRIRREAAFDEAWLATTRALAGLVRDQGVPASFSLEHLADGTLAALCTYWLDIPDGDSVIAGGRPSAGDKAPRCPFHSLPPSRFIFMAPHPRPAVEAMGQRFGRQLLDGVRNFVAKHRDRNARQSLKGELSKALFALHGDDEEALAKDLVGIIEGFLPTVWGNFLKLTHLWITEETLWRLQQDLCSTGDAGCFHAERVLEEPLHRAMMQRPIPDMLYRTALQDVDLGGLRVRAGERIVLSLAAATQDLTQQGIVSVAPLFGGMRSEARHPTHACPGYEMAMGVLLGMIAALLQAGTLSPAAHPFMKLGDPKPFFLKAPKGYAAR
jgi:Dyp-type peroxidase family